MSSKIDCLSAHYWERDDDERRVAMRFGKESELIADNIACANQTDWLTSNHKETAIENIRQGLERQFNYLVGIIEDLYDAVDTDHLSDELRDDIREILGGDV